MRKLIFELVIKEWKCMLFFILLSGCFCFMIFFSDLLFGWNNQMPIQVSSENLLYFQQIDQSFFEFQALSVSDRNIQLLEEESKWVLKNGEQLSIGMKMELIKLLMDLKEIKFEDSGDSLKNHLLILFSCLILLLNGCVLLIRNNTRFLKLKENILHRSEFLVLISRLVIIDIMTLCMIVLFVIIRNSCDFGKGWLLCMRKFGFISQLYNSFELFFYDHASDMVEDMILVLLLCILLSLMMYKICRLIRNGIIYILIGMSLFLIFYLLSEFMIFQNHFPDLMEYLPAVGLIFILKDICESTYVLSNVLFAFFIHMVVILAL